MDSVQAVLIFAGRAGMGILLAIAFSMVGIGLAWGIFVFSSSDSRTVLLSLFMAGAGIGAGLGGFLAWLRIDGNTLPVIIGTVTLALLAGVVGAWGGYQYGAAAAHEVACCAKPEIKPFTYTALGATVVANGVVLLYSLAREIATSRRRPVSRQL